MKRTEQVRYDMLKRVRDFGAAHSALFPESSAGGQAFATIARVVADIGTHAKEKVLAARQGRHTRRVARGALKRAMQEIARTARAAAVLVPGAENKLVMPRRVSTTSLLIAARTFIDEGQHQLDRLVPLGLAPTAFADLGVLADALDREVAGRAQGRTNVAHRQAAIAAALAEGLQTVRMLDAVVANVLKADPALFAGWERARRVLLGRTRLGAAAASHASLTADTPVVVPVPEPGEPIETPTGAATGEAEPQDLAPAAVPIDPLRRAS